MKYFKPALLAQVQSLNSEVADAAAEEWIRAGDNYYARLDALRSKLPVVVRQLARDFNIHDARYVSLTQMEKIPLAPRGWKLGRKISPRRIKKSLVLVLRVPGSNGKGAGRLQLSYELANRMPARWVRHLVPHQENSSGKRWVLYDELDIVDGGLYTHFLLMTGARELRIWFTSLHVAWTPSELPPVGQKSGSKVETTESQAANA